ncbi:DUF4856 domain-containing protein [Cytophagaceae bacterium AH-315-L13]|nr:DUF4856 domain-containing protein [Cytophagaceae bacterium AH-315-L13]
MNIVPINFRNTVILAIGSGLLFLNMGCGQKGCTDPNARNYDIDADKDDNSCVYDTGYTVPSTYNFDNVSHSGQTVRLLLLKDLTSKIAEADAGRVMATDLISIYENTESTYSSIAIYKNLKDKVASTSDDSLILDYFNQIDSLSSAGKGFVTADSLDLQQLVEKTLMGSIFWYQALEYLKQIPDDDNETVTAGKGTDMEHHFDEAFGYFGAALDYNDYLDTDIKSPGEKDSDVNGTIDPETEQCFYYGQTAAKRDLGAAAVSVNTDVDYTKAIFEAFLEGRAAITNIDYSKRNTAITTIEDNWEEIIAATVIHYINETKSDITSGSFDIIKHWAELKGYVNMLSYRSDNKIGKTDLASINTYLGTKPSEAVKTNLDAAASIIQEAYGFSDELVAGW